MKAWSCLLTIHHELMAIQVVYSAMSSLSSDHFKCTYI